MKKLFLSAVALSMLFVACKDDNTNPEPTPEPTITKLLSNIVSDKKDTTGFVYNNNNEIIKYEDYYAGNGRHTFAQLQYKDGKIVAQLSSAKSFEDVKKDRDLIYNDAGKLLRVNYLGPINYDSLAYDGNGRLTTIYVAQGFTVKGELDFYAKWVLTWDGKGNITEQDYVRLADGKPTGDTMKISFTFDDKVNFNAKQPQLFTINTEESARLLSANNFLTRKTVNGDVTVTTTNVYTYDEENYPVTMKSTVKVNEQPETVTNYQIRYIKQ